VIAAGEAPGRVLAAGTALRIMTGAPVPRGADRVVPFERTELAGDEVTIHDPGAAGAHVRRRGEVAREGMPLLAEGTLLGPEGLALAAAHGHRDLVVHGAPRVAVMTTGDEVVPPDQQPAPGQVRDSHTDFLLAAGRRLGLSFTSLGIAPDRADALGDRVAVGLQAADVLILGGGVSAGDFDLVEGVLADQGCHALFDAVAIQPGKPMVAAVRPAGPGRHQALVFGLPGNPAAVYVTFRLFVRPALLRLLGSPAHPLDLLVGGRLAAAAPGAKARERWVPARVEGGGGELRVVPLPVEGSHDLVGYARGTALLRIPAGAPPAPPGAPCEVLLPAC
jgi:molybdopterin molybdotransferase